MSDDFEALRMHIGGLCILIALSGLGVFEWPWALLGWGTTSIVLSFLALARPSALRKEQR